MCDDYITAPMRAHQTHYHSQHQLNTGLKRTIASNWDTRKYVAKIKGIERSLYITARRSNFNDAFLCHLGDGLNVANFTAFICYMWRNDWDLVAQSLRSSTTPLQPFHTSLAHLKFTLHLLSKAKISSAVLMVALIYIWRYRSNCGTKAGGQYTSEIRIMVVALMVACKYVDDLSYTSASWSTFTNIKASELSKMELEFLDGLKYNLLVKSDEWNLFKDFTKNIVFRRFNIPVYNA